MFLVDLLLHSRVLMVVTTVPVRTSYRAHNSMILPLALLRLIAPVPHSDAFFALVLDIVILAAMHLAGTNALALLDVDLLLRWMATIPVSVLVFTHVNSLEVICLLVVGRFV
jgi:hypothetical protein